jgi:4a-hydroxytetrahydrobiopterin dehydratase
MSDSSDKRELAGKQCVPCKGGVEPLKGQALSDLVKQLKDGWQVVDDRHLEKEYKFKNFKQALEFVNKVGEIAESQGHHPDIFLAWGKVKLMLWTHKIGGLHENDFILAAKADAIYQ